MARFTFGSPRRIGKDESAAYPNHSDTMRDRFDNRERQPDRSITVTSNTFIGVGKYLVENNLFGSTI
jgi:hypothetical protein